MPKSRTSRLYFFLACLATAFALLISTHVAFLAIPSSEAVRLRNALLLTPENLNPNDWMPENYPSHFKRDTLPPDPRLARVIEEIGANQGSDLQRALLIAGHLTEKAKDLGPIQGDTWTAYRLIREGKGYCADFTQVFIGLAYAAGLSVREWGFSFDGFGGRGHAVLEIYDRLEKRWIFLDVYNNFHAIAPEGRALSALELRENIINQSKNFRFVTNGPGRLGFVHEAKLREYYQRGVDGWFQVLGTNLQEYESALLVRLLGRFSRSAEQAAALLSGIHPKISILETSSNLTAIKRMRDLRSRLLIELPLLALSCFAAILFFLLSMLDSRKHARTEAASSTLTVLLVGPLPPPSGGMANQCEQLNMLLLAEGIAVNFVRTNSPYKPDWISSIKHVRALFRLIPFLIDFWRGLDKSDVVHLFANSGMAWYLVCLPVIFLSKIRGVPCIVNYRGGEAQKFFDRAPAWVARTLSFATLIVTPSEYLAGVFRSLNYEPRVIPNIVNLERFTSNQRPRSTEEINLLVTRNLEPIYDIPTALNAFTQVVRKYPQSHLTVAGSGPEEARLHALCADLGISRSVTFSGRIPNENIPALYSTADIVVNPSTVDNMPISILEAFACGVPVVSTDAGGIPFLACNGETAMLVGVGDVDAMANAILAVLSDKKLASTLSENGIAQAKNYSWFAIRPLWLETYREIAGIGRSAERA